MLPDGNYMFRSVAHLVFGDAEQHSQLRSTTVAVATQNGEVLKGYLPNGNVSLEYHLQ